MVTYRVRPPRAQGQDGMACRRLRRFISDKNFRQALSKVRKGQLGAEGRNGLARAKGQY